MQTFLSSSLKACSCLLGALFGTRLQGVDRDPTSSTHRIFSLVHLSKAWPTGATVRDCAYKSEAQTLTVWQ